MFHDTIMNGASPTLDILICTIDNGILKVPAMLLPLQEGTGYVVSMQYTSKEFRERIPVELLSRPDVTVVTLEGKGLSRNRNNAITHSLADVCLLADDDNRYTEARITALREAWRDNPDADILTFQAETHEGKPLHDYPAPYVCSVEISFRRKSILDHGIMFDGRFGLGSPMLKAGEEDVFMSDAVRAGLNVRYIPKVVVSTNAITTADGFLTDEKLQLTKGAVFRHVYGICGAIWRSVKEAGWYMVHRRANPFPILSNMIKGIWIFQ